MPLAKGLLLPQGFELLLLRGLGLLLAHRLKLLGPGGGLLLLDLLLLDLLLTQRL